MLPPPGAHHFRHLACPPVVQVYFCTALTERDPGNQLTFPSGIIRSKHDEPDQTINIGNPTRTHIFDPFVVIFCIIYINVDVYIEF